MTSVYGVSGGDNALRWLNLSTGVSPLVRATLGTSFPAANLAEGAGRAYSAADGPAPLSLTDSVRLVEASASAGKAIVGYLQTLRSVTEQARLPGYSSELGAQAVTASSRTNLQVQADNLLALINGTAFAARVDGEGLLDGGRNTVTLSTTALGGKVAAASQPLTTWALGISGLDLLSDPGIADALSRVNLALETAVSRNQNLQALGQMFQEQAAYISNLATAYAQGDAGRLSQLTPWGNLGYGQGQLSVLPSRGTLVDILG